MEEMKYNLVIDKYYARCYSSSTEKRDDQKKKIYPFINFNQEATSPLGGWQFTEEILEELSYKLDETWQDGYNTGYIQRNTEKEPDLLGRKDINFSILPDCESNPEKAELYKEQRLERGWDDTELWNLDSTILKFTLPRLKRFKEVTAGYPPELENLEEWKEIIQKMIDSFEKYLDSEPILPEDEGFELFHKYFFNLWWQNKFQYISFAFLKP